MDNIQKIEETETHSSADKEFSLNDESDFGITESSALIAEHKFVWMLREYTMVAGMVIIGGLMSIFVKPFFFGLMLVAGGLGLVLVNQSKKKSSLLQLYQTPKGLRIYHKGKLSNSASSAQFELSDTGEVGLSESNGKPLLVLKGKHDRPVTGFDYFRMPVRMARTEEISKLLDKWIEDPNIKVSKSVVDIQKDLKKMDKRN
jgi:hypothetical protein